MTAEEWSKLAEMFREEMQSYSKRINELSQTQSEQSSKIDEIYVAMIGNKLKTDKGMIWKIEDIDKRVNHIEGTMDSVKNKAIGVSIGVGLGGGGLAVAIVELLKMLK